MNYDEILAKSDYTATSDKTLDTYAEESASAAKAKALEEARKAKMERLGNKNQGANLDSSYSVLPSGTIESNKNKIWNDLNAADKQTALGETVAEYGVYKEGDKYYQGTGSSRREYTGNIEDLRRAYMYGTKDDPNAVKFGLARGDLPSSDYRYLPGQAEAEGYNVGKNGYGWDPGENGVDLSKKYMDVLLPYEKATALEGMIHGNTGALEDRKYKDYLSDEALQHASGVSEYYNSAEGMLGDTSNMTEEEYKKAAAVNEVEGFSQLPGAQDKYVNANKITETDINKAVSQAMDNDGYLGNLVDGLQSSGGALIAKTGDTVADALVKASRTARQMFTGESNQELNQKFQEDIKGTFMEDWFGKDGDFQLFDKYKDQEEYGYDNTLIANAEESVKKAWKSGSVSDILDAVVDTVKAAPDLLVTSSADMLLAAAGPVGIGLYAANFNNEILENRAEIKGGIDKLTAEDYVIAPLAAVPAAVLNKVTMGNAGIREFTEAAKKAISLGGPSVAKEIGKAITKGSITEGLEEGAQTALIDIGSKIATAKQDELGSDQFWEDVVVGSALGAGAGGVTAGAGSAARESKELYKVGKEYITDKLDNQSSGEETERAASWRGRKTRFESIGTPGFEVDEKSKQAYAKDAAGYVADVWFDADIQKDSEKYVAKPATILDDAVDKVMSLYGAEGEAARAIVKAEVVRDVLESANAGRKEDGTKMASDEEIDTFIKQALDQYGDSERVQAEVNKVYSDRIRAKMEQAKEELGEEGSALDTIPLTQANYDAVKKVIADMRSLGSDSTTSFADRLDKGLKLYSESLGSAETGTDTVRTKTIDEVADEALVSGFFDPVQGVQKKGIQEHAIDVEDFLVKNPEGFDRQKNDIVNDLARFVGSRKGKIIPITRKDGIATPRTVGQINKFVKYNYAENKKIADVVSKALKSNSLTDAQRKNLETASSKLNDELEHLNKLNTLYKDGNYRKFYEEVLNYAKQFKHTSEELTRNTAVKEYMATLDGTSSTQADTEIDIEVDPKVEELLNKRKAWVDKKVAEGKDPEKLAVTIDTNTKLSPEERSTLAAYARSKVVTADKKSDIKKKSEEKTAPNLTKDEISLYEQAKEGSVSDYKAEANKTTGPVNEPIAKTETIEAVEATIANIEDIKSSIEENTDGDISKDLDALGAQIDAHIKTINALETEKLAVKSRIKEHKNRITKLYAQARKDDARERKLSKGNRKNSKVLETIEYLLDSIKLVFTMIQKYKDLIKADVNKIKDINKEIREYKNDIKAIKKIAQAEKYRYIGIPDVNGVLETSKSTGLSFSNKLRKALEEGKDSTKEVMSMMPRIIKDAGKEGENRLKSALDVLSTFSKDRAKINVAVQEYKSKDAETNEEKNARRILVQYGLQNLLNDQEAQGALKAAMDAVSIVMFSKMSGLTTYNSQQMENTVNGAFGNLYPNNYNKVPVEMMPKFERMLRTGEIVPLAMFNETAGQLLLKELDKKLTKNISIKDKAAIEAALGAIVLSNMVTSVNPEKEGVNGAVRKVLVRDMTTGEVKVEDTSAKLNDVTETKTVFVLSMKEMGKEYHNMLMRAGATLEFAQNKDIPAINTEPITMEVGTKVRNGNTEISEEAVKYLSKQGSTPWKFGEEMKQIAEEYNKFENESDVARFKEEVLGNLDTILANTVTMKAESVYAKYVADELQIDRMIEVYKLVGDKEFYIPWDYIISGRNMMDSMMINPQNSKVSRFLVAANDMRVEVDTTNKEYRDYIEIAATQALDLGLDKKLDTEVLAELNKEFFKFDGDKLDISMAHESFQNAVKNPTLANVNKINTVVEEGLGVAERMHILQLVQLLNKLDKGETKVYTQLALEVDGITNGMSSTLIQIGYNTFTVPLLNKTGYYVKRPDQPVYRSHGEFKSGKKIEDGTDVLGIDGKPVGKGVDIYQTPEEAAKKELGANADVVTDIIGNAWRNFLKSPVMVYIYGSGMNNIRKNTASSLIVGNSYIKGGLAGGKLEEVLKLANMENAKDMVEYKKYNAETGRFEDTTSRDPKYAYINDKNLSKVIAAIDKNVGKAFEDAFQQSFGEMSKFRQSLKIVDQLNYIVYKSRLAEEMTKLGKLEISDLTPAELAEVNAKLVEEGTYYGADNATGGVQDYVKMEKVPGSESWQVVVRSAAFQSNSNSTSMDIGATVKQLVANVGAVGVTTVHDIDGSVMIKGHKKDVLNIYDALMLGVNPQVNGQQITDMNKTFYEINTSHSILGKAVQKLLKNFRNPEVNLNLDTLSDVFDYTNTLNDLARVLEMYGDVNGVLSAIQPDNLIKDLDNVDASREAMKDAEVVSNQYYATDKVEGYKAEKAAEVETVYKDKNRDREDLRLILQMVSDNMAKGREAKGRSKKKASIISKLEKAIDKAPTAAKSWLNKELSRLIKEGNEGC